MTSVSSGLSLGLALSLVISGIDAAKYPYVGSRYLYMCTCMYISQIGSILKSHDNFVYFTSNTFLLNA